MFYYPKPTLNRATIECLVFPQAYNLLAASKSIFLIGIVNSKDEEEANKITVEDIKPNSNDQKLQNLMFAIYVLLEL